MPHINPNNRIPSLDQCIMEETGRGSVRFHPRAFPQGTLL